MSIAVVAIPSVHSLQLHAHELFLVRVANAS